MAENKQKFYLTTPIYYVNARPHIGHAYTTIVADVLARRHRLLGEDVFLLTGTDEHGQKIERSAAAAGIPPQQFADQVSASFRALWDRMGITYDDYIRTTEPRHAQGAQLLLTEIYKHGYIELHAYTGAYCVSDETFVDLPVGTPCPDCGRPLEEVTEENYFFRLSAFQTQLIDLIESGTLVIEPETRRNEVLSFLRGGLAEVNKISTEIAESLPHISGEGTKQFLERVQKEANKHPEIIRLEKEGELKRSSSGGLYVPGALKDLSISRSSFTWGIPVPEPVASMAEQKHVIYVWLDALANYMTAVGYGSNKPEDIAKFEKYWPADLHLVGKEIIRFHCVYWPAFLLAAGLPLPKKVQAHGWLLFEESKMSKSRGNIVRTETILDAFGNLVYASQFPESTHAEQDLFAADTLRYFLLREIPFGNDGSFSFDAFIERYNAALVKGYGSLVSRVLRPISKSFQSQIPAFELAEEDKKKLDNFERAINVVIGTDDLWNDFAAVLKTFEKTLEGANAVIDNSPSWELLKSDDPADHKKAATGLYMAAAFLRLITALVYPMLPYTTAKVWSQLGLGDIELAARNGELKNLQWGTLKPGTKLGPLAPIFPRAEKGLAQIMTDMEANNAPAKSEAPAEAPKPESPTITIDDFAKIDLRAAKVLVAERIPKADKLLRLEVDLGNGEKRQILSGIAEHYTPEDLIGRRIVIIANLAPRKMRGLESHGMLLAASEGENGKPILATFAEDIAPGSRLK